MKTPGPPPNIVNDGLVITETDYFGGPWDLAGVPFLSNHRGVLRLLCPYLPWRHMMEFSCDPPLILTRGKMVCGCEAVEFFFPEPRSQSFYVLEWQTNRLPSNPCGKRPWEVEIWFSDRGYMGMHKRFYPGWRDSSLPCMQPWKGYFPDFRHHPTRNIKRAEPFAFHLGQPYKKGGRPRYEVPIPVPKANAWRWREDFKGRSPYSWRFPDPEDGCGQT